MCCQLLRSESWVFNKPFPFWSYATTNLSHVEHQVFFPFSFVRVGAKCQTSYNSFRPKSTIFWVLIYSWLLGLIYLNCSYLLNHRIFSFVCNSYLYVSAEATIYGLPSDWVFFFNRLTSTSFLEVIVIFWITWINDFPGNLGFGKPCYGCIQGYMRYVIYKLLYDWAIKALYLE